MTAYKPRLEHLEPRDPAASLGWDGPGQGSARIGYYIHDSIPTELRPGILRAMEAWSKVIDITFYEGPEPHQLGPFIDFKFKTLPADRVAQAKHPGDEWHDGNVWFNTQYKFELGNSLGRFAYDITLTAVHEIGHAIGLHHPQPTPDGEPWRWGGVMTPSISSTWVYQGLGSPDMKAALSIYAPAIPAATTDAAIESLTKADMDGDGCVTFQDHNALRALFGKSITSWQPKPDINGDGRIDLHDFALLAQHNHRCLPVVT